MRGSQRKAVEMYRVRMKTRGLARLEVQVPEEDAPLLRSLARALCDPARAGAVRGVLRESAILADKVDLKELLASAPLEGLDLERSRDTGRDVEF